jgi:hypothetical protein
MNWSTPRRLLCSKASKQDLWPCTSAGEPNSKFHCPCHKSSTISRAVYDWKLIGCFVLISEVLLCGPNHVQTSYPKNEIAKQYILIHIYNPISQVICSSLSVKNINKEKVKAET